MPNSLLPCKLAAVTHSYINQLEKSQDIDRLRNFNTEFNVFLCSGLNENLVKKINKKNCKIYKTMHDYVQLQETLRWKL